jgi:hypothetical protein
VPWRLKSPSQVQGWAPGLEFIQVAETYRLVKDSQGDPQSKPDLSMAWLPREITDMHHRMPQYLGGDESPSNLIALCGSHQAIVSARQDEWALGAAG